MPAHEILKQRLINAFEAALAQENLQQRNYDILQLIHSAQKRQQRLQKIGKKLCAHTAMEVKIHDQFRDPICQFQTNAGINGIIQQINDERQNFDCYASAIDSELYKQWVQTKHKAMASARANQLAYDIETLINYACQQAYLVMMLEKPELALPPTQAPS